MADQLVQDLDNALAAAGVHLGLVNLVDQVAGGSASALGVLDANRALIRQKAFELLLQAVPNVPGLREALQSVDGTDPSPAGATRTAALGPALVGVTVPTAVVKVPGRADPYVIAPVPSLTGSLGLDAPELSGGGALAVSPERLAGAFGVGVGPLKVLGTALLRVPPGRAASLLVLLSARFAPAVQLGFGFGLSEVGGIVGANRRVATDRLRQRLADGGAAAALFPADPVRDAGTLWEALEEFFPVSPGTQVLGPTFALSWLDLGDAGSLVQADAALLLQLPDAKFVLAGRATIDLPPVLAVKLDVLGELDVSRQLVAVDAVLVDSRALSVFRVTGSGAIRVCWGSPPYVVVAVGGFYPGFDPAPAVVPPQQRLGLALDLPSLPFLSLRADGYLAITANSFQVGGSIEVGVDLAVIAAHGSIALDAIVTFDPFHLHVDFQAGWQVRVAIFSGGISASGTVDGPGPWTIHVSVSKELLLDDISWSDTFRIGPAGPAPAPPIQDVAALLAAEFRRASNLHADGAQDRSAALAPAAGRLPDGTVVVSPLGRLRWTQGLVPLGLPIARVGGRRLDGQRSVDVAAQSTGVTQGGRADDWFAPGTYLDLTRAEACQLPPFQRLRAGFDLELHDDPGAAQACTIKFQAYWRRPADPKLILALGLSEVLSHRTGFDRLVAAPAAAPTVTNRSPLVSVGQEAWSTVAGGTRAPADSAAHAFLAAREGGIALAAEDRPVDAKGL
ncbi:hypothetical protein KV557_31460 [Kitasatospora aureofaciens]|uniref:DUF6603 domain-containing protein n=1 Tax=Kitasatospora aureofaciens TaxID=1894 RepID=UPI001C48F78D|nr:DUF6603 domain-containing protein [Kitasatospora aureofaciens]MBV6701578.1 hypothetical protein [Kitasatospora aureofaciens]